MEAEWYCHPQKCDNGGDTQSVEDEVEQEEEPAKIILSCTIIPIMYQYLFAVV